MVKYPEKLRLAFNGFFFRFFYSFRLFLCDFRCFLSNCLFFNFWLGSTDDSAVFSTSFDPQAGKKDSTRANTKKGIMILKIFNSIPSFKRKYGCLIKKFLCK